MKEKNASNLANIGSLFASSIINPYLERTSLLGKLLNRVTTGFYLSNIKNSFIDFEKLQFPSVAMSLYQEVHKAHNKRNKTELFRLLTQPNYDIINHCHKYNLPLPFSLYAVPKSANIISAFITSEQGDNIDVNNFAHITLEMLMLDSEGKTKRQVNVFERRLDVKLLNAWKIALIEDADL